MNLRASWWRCVASKTVYCQTKRGNRGQSRWSWGWWREWRTISSNGDFLKLLTYYYYRRWIRPNGNHQVLFWRILRGKTRNGRAIRQLTSSNQISRMVLAFIKDIERAYHRWPHSNSITETINPWIWPNWIRILVLLQKKPTFCLLEVYLQQAHRPPLVSRDISKRPKYPLKST